VLNLFGYTGLASLVAARAGAEVTHVDASKKAIGWARENQEMARLGDRPIRWICEDAMKFAEREERRRNAYDIVLFDPPAYGRGPKGEVWQLFDDLPRLTDICRSILTPKQLAVVLTAYSIRSSFFAIHALVRDTFAGMGGTVESGELIIREKSAGRALSTSLFSRWVAS
jgi:23S rRNA (cytosine1962-C5)-methyltransferase